nr:protein kinase-like domain, phloem protein 2-like protein [Tanacetum cinerariifolium]
MIIKKYLNGQKIVCSEQRRRNSTQFSDEGSWSTMVNSIDKHGKKCLMLSAKATWIIDDKNSAFESSQEPRNTHEDYYTCYANVKDVALAHILVYEWCELDGSGVTRGTCNATICKLQQLMTSISSNRNIGFISESTQHMYTTYDVICIK